MPPVATTTPSLTRGDALPMRLMAPSTMHLVGAQRLQPLDGDAELGERGGPADLHGAVAGGLAR